MTTNAGTTSAHGKSGYAPVNGLEMYYEIHGAGSPLIFIPGGLMTIDLMGALLPSLAKTRQVIAIEPQGHGHTSDINRPLTYEHMADDTRRSSATWASNAPMSSAFPWVAASPCRPRSAIQR